MKSRLLTGVLAAVMAITVIVGGTARPAKAVWQVWAGVALSVAQSLFSGGSSSGDLERAKREIIDAVNAARQEMLDHIDDVTSTVLQAESDVTKRKAEQGIEWAEAALTPADAWTADELFLTGTGAEIVPVCEIDGRPLPAERPVTEFARAAFAAYIEASARAVVVEASAVST